MNNTDLHHDPTLVGFADEIRVLDTWVKQHDSVGLFVTGQAGSGKSHLIHTYFNNNCYETISIHPGNFHKRMCTSDYFHQLSRTNRLYVGEHVNKRLPLVIIIDQLEGISSMEKSGITGIVNYLKDCKRERSKQKQKQRKNKTTTTTSLLTGEPVFKRGTRIICLCQNVYVKKARELELLCDLLPISEPTREDIRNRLLDIVSPDTIDSYVTQITPDYRKLSTIPSIPTNMFYLLSPFLKYYGLHDISSRILQSLEPIPTIRHYYSTQKVLLPLMIHENYRPAIPDDDPLFSSHIYRISKIISNSSILAHYTLNQNEWGLGEYHTLLSCFIPSNYIKYNCNIRRNTNPDTLQVGSSWPAMLNRMSLHCTYKHTYYDNTLDKNTYTLDRNSVRFNNERLKRMFQTVNNEDTENPSNRDHDLLTRMSIYRIRDEKHVLQVQKCM